MQSLSRGLNGYGDDITCVNGSVRIEGQPNGVRFSRRERSTRTVKMPTISRAKRSDWMRVLGHPAISRQIDTVYETVLAGR